MYEVYDSSGGGASGVMFSANGSVYYKASDNNNYEPTWVSDGTIVGRVVGFNLNLESNPDSVVVVANGSQLYWAYNTTQHEIGSSALSSETEVANLCTIPGTGFYFSSHNTGAKLWFVPYSSGSFGAPGSYDMTSIGSWQADTRISWITAVPKVGVQTYDVMFSGDRCYKISPPYPAIRYTDGRQLWGMLSTAIAPTEIDANVGDEFNHPCPWYYGDPPLNGKCPGEMVISINNVAIDEGTVGTLYFATNSTTLSQLWKSNGTPEGTMPVYNLEDLPTQAGEVPFNQVVGMDGYLDTVANPDVTRVYFWLADSYPSDMWVTDGTPYDPDPDPPGPFPTPITGFDLTYCDGPTMSRQHVGGSPFAIVTDTRDPLYGTVYFTAGVYNSDGDNIYSLYKLKRGQTTVYDDQMPATWNNAIWDSGIGPNSACKWLTLVETYVSDELDNHKLYFRGGQPVNANNMRNRGLYYFDPQASPNPTVYGVDLSGDSVPDMDVSWLVDAAHASPQRLYYFSLYGTQGTNVKLCWWDMQ